MGSFFIETTGRVGIVDFGMVSTLDDRLRDQLSRLRNGFLQDPGRLADALLGLGTSTGRGRIVARLREDLAELLARQFGRSVGEISLRSAFGETLEIVRRHRLRVPRDLSLLFTMLIIADGWPTSIRSVELTELAADLPTASIASPRQSRRVGSRSTCAPNSLSERDPTP